MPDHKTTYLQFCETATSLPLFFQPWWLDQVCIEGTWEVALSFDQGDQVIGVLPYYLRKVWGIRMVRIPRLTPYLGIWLNYPENLQKRNRRYAFEKKVMTNLLEQVPRLAYNIHQHPVEVDNGLPFLWQGYELSNWYTYRFAANTPLESIKEGMKASVRNKIEKAHQSLVLEESDEVEVFFKLNEYSFQRQGRNSPYSLDFLRKLDQELVKRGQRKIYLARDEKGQAQGGIYLVWDQHTVYNLAMGVHPEWRNSGAVQLLLWQAIRWAMDHDRSFDFEGSVLENIEGVFRDFGGERLAYLRTSRYANPWWKALGALMEK